MLTWFQAGLILGENLHDQEPRVGRIGDPCEYFWFCTGAKTESDHADFRAGVEAAKKMS